MKEKNYLFSAPTLILLSIGIIALFGFAFLAFEGGRIYVERQQLRSLAAETAAQVCTNTQSDPERMLASKSGMLANNVVVYHPPTSGVYAGDMNYIEVTISQFISGGLVDLASSEKVSVTANAVVYCEAAASVISLVDLP